MSNQEVKLKRKVQLREKVEEPSIIPTPPDNGNTPKSKKWIWAVAAIIVVGLIGYWALFKSDKVTEENRLTEVVEEGIAEQPTTTSELKKDDIADENPVETYTTASSENIPDSQAETKQIPVADSNKSGTNETSAILTDTHVSNDVEAEAMKVIRGDYGVGQERKNKLGVKYQTIQKRVNELKREGVF